MEPIMNPVERFLTLLSHIEAGGCTEIRIIPKTSYVVVNGRREYVGKVVAGYYTDYEKAARNIAPFDGKAAIYATLNPCDLKLMRRSHNKLAFGVKVTAKDEDIISILWFPFDVDPIRPADTPSSDNELALALACRDRIICEVFEPHGVPVIPAMSGNGAHGLIPLIGYSNTPETQAKMKRLLDWLADTFSNDLVSVDRTVGNPSRIWKVYGTLAVKGDNTPDAPHRRASLEPPKMIERVDLSAIIDLLIPSSFQLPVTAHHSPLTAHHSPLTTHPSRGEYPRLDVDRYLAHYSIEAKRRDKGSDVVWRMDCPFNPDHRGDAQLQQEASGRLGFVCPHDSCRGRNWMDFRGVYDPTPFFEGSSKRSSGRTKTARPTDDSTRDRVVDTPKPNNVTRDDLGTAQATTVPKSDDIQFSDGWRAKQLVKSHGVDLHFCGDWDKWLIWDGKRWRTDRTLEIMRRAKSVTVKMLRDAADALESGDDVSAKFIRAQAKIADTRAKYEAMISLAKSEHGIAIIPESLDVDPWRLTVENGTVDLQMGELVTYQREHLITRLAPVTYDATAKCPRWMDAMNLWMDGNAEVIDFLQCAVGYSLTGRIHEQVLMILYGEGANGKTVFLETLMGMLGEYARHSEPDLLIMRRHENHPTGLADLVGARFVATTEIGEFARLHEPLVKRLTGGDKMKARYMYQNWFEFEPTHKLWIGTNHKPIIRGTDYGIWRRIRLVPFLVEISEREQIPRAILLELLRKEWPGILNWAIEGCLKWQVDGLPMSDSIRSATQAYREQMDIVGRFIEERCELDGESQATALYQAFKGWCEHGGEFAISQRVFGEKLAAQGLEKVRSGAKSIVWKGIQLAVSVPLEQPYTGHVGNGHAGSELI